jgi:hypothetical protein
VFRIVTGTSLSSAGRSASDLTVLCISSEYAGSGVLTSVASAVEDVSVWGCFELQEPTRMATVTTGTKRMCICTFEVDVSL